VMNPKHSIKRGPMVSGQREELLSSTFLPNR